MHILPTHAKLGPPLATEELCKRVLISSQICEPGVAGRGIGGTLAIGVVTVEAARGTLGARGVDFPAVEPRPLVRIAEQIVSCREILEFFLGLFVTRVEVGM
jgi:hypothetical protein